MLTRLPLFSLLLLIALSTSISVSAQRNPSICYGNYSGDIVENGAVVGKMVMIVQAGEKPDDLIFITNVIERKGVTTEEITTYKGEYHYLANDDIHSAMFDYSSTQKSNAKKKVKGDMAFKWLPTSFHGNFFPKGDGDDYITISWKLKPLDLAAIAEETGMTVMQSLDYGAIDDFHEGFALVRRGERFGIIDKNGKDLVPLGQYDLGSKYNRNNFDEGAGFKNGMCMVKDVETGKYGFIDTTGKLVVPCTFRSAQKYREDGYGFGEYVDAETNKYYRFYLDKKGKRYASDVVEGTAMNPWFIQKEAPDYSKTTFIRKNGSKAFETAYRVGKYSEGLYKVNARRSDNGMKYGFMDTTGKLVIPMRFNPDGMANLGDFHEGLVVYRPAYQDEYLYAFLNKKGEEVIRLRSTTAITSYRNVEGFENGFADCYIEIPNGRDQKALIDKEGNVINPEKLFRLGNPEFFQDLSNVWSPNFQFTYVTRNKFGIVFTIYAALKPNSKSAQNALGGRMSATGGVGGGTKFYEQRGTGMMDYTGRIIIDPIFTSLGKFDEVSGLAKAIMTVNNQTTQVFVTRPAEVAFKMIKNNDQFIRY